MEPGSDDHVLDVLRMFAGGALVSVGTEITVLCGPARIEGAIANSSDYTEHLGETLSAAFRETAAAAGDDQVRAAAEHLAEVYARTGTSRRTNGAANGDTRSQNDSTRSTRSRTPPRSPISSRRSTISASSRPFSS